MYNRYIPQPDGSFRRNHVPEPPPPAPPKRPAPPEPPCTPEPESCGHPPPNHPPRQGGSILGFFKQLLPKNMDTADLLIILLLLLMAGDSQEEQNTALLTLALYFFM